MIKIVFGIIFLVISIVLICIVIGMVSLPLGLGLGALAFFMLGCLLLSFWAEDERKKKI